MNRLKPFEINSLMKVDVAFLLQRCSQTASNQSGEAVPKLGNGQIEGGGNRRRCLAGAALGRRAPAL